MKNATGHIANQLQLLVVLLTKIGIIGLHQVQQAHDNSQNTIEMTWAMCTAQLLGEFVLAYLKR